MKPRSHTPQTSKSGIHPRNKNSHRYDFPTLIALYPELGQFVFTNTYGKETIDFSNPAAVRTLNTVLLRHHYHIAFWELPPDHLCPPIPGRADYLHHLADLLASCNDGVIPAGNRVAVLDIGVGANCIYPLIGQAEYGWKFVGSDTDLSAIGSAQRILEGNNIPADTIELRQQTDFTLFFRNIIKPDEYFDATICNPPFHSTIEQATTGTRRKWKNLGVKKSSQTDLNFGGKHHELLYPGGEQKFIQGLVTESIAFAENVFWFSTLVSKQSILSLMYKELEKISPKLIQTVNMSQGQKKTRFVAWTFHDNNAQRDWKRKRWNTEKTNVDR